MRFGEFMSHPFVDLATAFVEQGQELVLEQEQRQVQERARQVQERAFAILSEKCQVQQEEFERDRAAMYEQDSQNRVIIQGLEQKVKRLEAQIEDSQQQEQQAINASIGESRLKDEAQERVAVLEAALVEKETQPPASKLVAVDQAELKVGDRVIFVKRSGGTDASVAFQAVCDGEHLYYLHQDCVTNNVDAGSIIYLIGCVIGLEDINAGSTMVFADIE